MHDKTKNNNIGLDIRVVTAGSSKMAYWICPIGHTYSMRINKRRIGQNCRYCANRAVWKGFNDLSSCFPDIAKEWDFSKNKLKPEEIIYSSWTEVYWICGSCGYSYSNKIYRRTKENVGCPMCTKSRRIAKKKLSQVQKTGGFAQNYPDLLIEWDYEKNKDINPYELNISSREKVYWLGKNCGHSWKASIVERTHGCNCIYCSNRVVLEGFNDLRSRKEEISLEWNYEKNGEIKPEMVYEKSTILFWWKCSICGREWQAKPINRNVLGCHKCQTKSRSKKRIRNMINRGRGFNPNKHKELLKDWDYEKNEYDYVELTEHSNQNIYWKCQQIEKKEQIVRDVAFIVTHLLLSRLFFIILKKSLMMLLIAIFVRKTIWR